MPETKIQSGGDRLYTWLAPSPLKLGATPTLSLTHADVATAAPAYAAIAAEGTVVAIGGKGQKVLTLSAPIPSVAGIDGSLGEAYLITAEDGTWPVRVTRIDDTQVILADPLPRKPSLTSSARLQFRRWTTTLTVAAVTGTARRNWTAYTSYIEQSGADAPESPQTYRELLHVVLQPFDTGLTHESLIQYFTELASASAGRQQSYQPQIDRAEERMVRDIRRLLSGNDCSKVEDDVEGGTLTGSHAYLTASLIYDLTNPDLSDRLEAKYTALLETELAHVWLDCNGDGVVDAGENPSMVPSMVDTSTFFRRAAPTTIFTRDSSH